MSSTFPYTSPNNIEEVSFVGGSYQQFYFNVYDSDGNPVSLAGSTSTWALSYYSDPTVILSITPTTGSATNQRIVNVSGSSTSSLSGKFIHQFNVVDSSGSSFTPSQGVLNIFPSRV